MSSDVILQEGSNFCGYLIGRELGRGGFGAVYLAEEIRLQRKVAIKVLHPGKVKDKKSLRRFEIEALASTRINHPSIVQVYAASHAPDGTHYIAMEYVVGDTLQARLKGLHARNQRLGSTKVQQVGLQVARALTVAHEKGLFHRDLKPHNLVLCEDEDAPGGERVKILDFGIAKLLPGSGGDEVEEEESGATSTGDQLPGTYAYMAPEQFGTYKGVTGLEGRMDVYSLGVLMYQALAGRLPIYNADPTVMMGLALVKEPDSLLSVDPSIPPRLAELVHLMLTKEADNRPTMAYVRDVLAHLLGLSASRPEIVSVRSTAEHKAFIEKLFTGGGKQPTGSGKLSTGQMEAAVASTGDAPLAGLAEEKDASGKVPPIEAPVGKSIGERATALQLASGDLVMTTGRSVGQMVTGPQPSAPRRSNRVLVGAAVGALLFGTSGVVAVLKFPLQSKPATHAATGAASPPQVAPVASPIVPPAVVTAQPTAPEVATTAATDETELAPSKPTKSKVGCVVPTGACVSGSISAAQRALVVGALEEADIKLCQGDRLVLAAKPKLGLRAASGVKHQKQEHFMFALRGSFGTTAFDGEIEIKCKGK